jgi:putative component of membrane protein insertase Oxa1/YidC/SpoIIIJ protein YidD
MVLFIRTVPFGCTWVSVTSRMGRCQPLLGGGVLPLPLCSLATSHSSTERKLQGEGGGVTQQ